MYRKLLLTLFSLVICSAASAQSVEEKGLAIATEADRRDEGFHDLKATMTMLLRNRRGEESLREMRSSTLEVEGDGDKTLIVFDQPRDVKGTALLSFTHKTRPDDQWLYLPALKRVKRISSKNKSGPFMGSEFAYEDISSQEIEKYTYRYVRDDKLGSQPMYVIERDPVDENSGYTRQLVWIDKQEYRPFKVDYYDRKNKLLKTLEYRGYKQYLNKFWRPDAMFMSNHQTGKSTLLSWLDYQFQVGLTDKDFTKNALKRAR